MERNYIQKTMKNGVRVFLYPDDSKHTVLVDYLVLFGGYDRDFCVSGMEYHMVGGLAHFLEHYIVERSPFGNLLDQFRSRYFQTNALTGTQSTEFYFRCTKDLEDGLSMLLEAVDHPVFDKQKIEDTKPAIYEEIRMKQDNQWVHFYTRLRHNMFYYFNYDNNLGTLDDVMGMTEKDLKLCHSVFYRPENKCLILSGCFDPESVMNWLEMYYQAESQDSICYESITKEEPKDVVRTYDELYLPGVNQAVGIGYKIDISHISLEKRDLFRYAMIYTRLKFGQCSALCQELEERDLIIGRLSFHFVRYSNYVALNIVAHTNDSESFLEVVRDHMKQDDILEEEFLRAQRAARSDEVVKYDDLGDLNDELVWNLTSFDYGQLDLEEEWRTVSFPILLDLIHRLSFDQETVLIMKDEVKQ